MKFLTREWYELCQRTGLHFGMKVHNGAAVYDEALYLRLYKRKEKEFVTMQHQIYDVDPRFMLEDDGCTLVPIDKFVNGEKINEEEKIIYHMPPEEKKRIQKLIEKYDARPPFDEKKCKENFRLMQETTKNDKTEKLPYELSRQIVDIRVFSLGYCTKEVLSQLKKLSKENEKKMRHILNEYSKAQQSEDIPKNIDERFAFHDCKITELSVGENVVMRLDTQGGFTDFDKITFVASEIIKQEKHIAGSIWLYQELYRRGNGYEAHMLLAGEEIHELIICCNDIIINKEYYKRAGRLPLYSKPNSKPIDREK